MEKTEERGVIPVPLAVQAEASSAHSRINIPVNVGVWAGLPESDQEDLLWLHQYLLDNQVSWKGAEEALDYDSSTIFRILKGNYEGSWANILKSVRSFKRLVMQRATLHTAHFRPNPISKRIAWALDYILARGSCGLILGEAGMGKTVGIKQWSTQNNHGRSVLVECLPIGGAKGLLRQIAGKVGVNKNLSITQGFEAVLRAFNKNRILILDEAHQLLPVDPRSRPVSLEMVRRLHDLSGCALAMVSTVRFDTDLKAQRYMFEQILGRTGKPFMLPAEFDADDIRMIVTQFLPRPTAKFMETMVAMANSRDLGRLRYVVECLTFASKKAFELKRELSEDLVLASHKQRDCGGVEDGKEAR